jgi:hypothetical protein
MESDVPESLMIALESRHHDAVRAWWHALSDDQRADFLTVAVLAPDEIAHAISPEEEQDIEEANDWYEYLVNQDVRFYFDRSHPQGNYNMAYPIIAPICSASDARVVSHLLTRSDTGPHDG